MGHPSSVEFIVIPVRKIYLIKHSISRTSETCSGILTYDLADRGKRDRGGSENDSSRNLDDAWTCAKEHGETNSAKISEVHCRC